MEGQTVGGRFVVERKVGTGAMGSVYRAVDNVSGQPVALKVLIGPGEHAERFARETAAIAGIQHPAAVGYVAHGVLPSGEQWLAMQWIEGETLHKRLQRGKLSVHDTLVVARRVAAALGAAHAKKLVHRDVKPGNVMLPGGALDQAVLVDFGLARHIAATEVTRTGMFVGTPGYMAPEQARGDRDLGSAVDVFSLGAMIFKCASGRNPFPGDELVAVLAKILFEPAPRLADLVPDVPDALDDLVARMLAKNPADRPRDGAAVLRELEAIDAAPIKDDSGAVRRSSLPVALTPGEQRLVCVVVAQAEPPSLTGTGAAIGRERLLPVAKEFGGALETLANGAFIVTLSGSGAATEQVVLAARCALRVEQELEHVPVALATGRSIVSGKTLPVGEAIDRAGALLAAEVARRETGVGRRGVRVDETTAGLVDARFEVIGDEVGLFLARERLVGHAARELLGMVTPCVGRERELGALLAAWQECEEQPMTAITLLIGEAGVGKSRVRYEFVRRVKERGDTVEVWACRGDPMRVGSPFALARQIVLQAAGMHEGEPLAVRQQKLRARVARNVPPDQVARVSAFLGEMAGVPFPDDDDVQLRSARRDPMLLGDLVQGAWDAFLAAECGENPVLITMEDLQWGDLPTIKLIDGALRAVGDAPLMVFALARPEVNDAFPKLWSGRAMTVSRLGAISRKAAEKLVRHVLADRVTAPTVARIVELAGGNVFYLEELIRAVAAGEGALPETVLAMVHARISALEPEARQVLRAASVFGYVFWEAGVRALVDAMIAPHVGAWLEALHEREIVSRRTEGRFPETRELIFRNELVREAAYATLTPGDLATGHRLAAAWLEQAGEGDARVLAAHWERSGHTRNAVRWYLRAAEQAMGGNDLEGALECANHGVACGASGEELGQLHTYLGTIAWWRGDSTIAVAQLEQATALLPEASDAWCHAAGPLVAAFGRMHKVAELRVLADRVEAAAYGEMTAGRAIALAQTCVAFVHAGDPGAAAKALALLESRADSPAFEEPLVAARAATARAMVAVLAGDTGAAMEWMTVAMRAFESIGDRRNATAQRVNLGYALAEVGMYERAERELREVLVVADRMGIDSVTAAAKQNLGLALTHLGRHEEARLIEEESVEAFRVQRRPRMVDGSRIYLAHILARGGHLDEARAIADEICAREDVTPTFRAYALAMLAHVRLLREENEAALDAARAAHEQLETLKSVDEGESLIRLVWAEALYANGREEEALAAILDAERRVRARAARMTNEAVREAFLDQVPENALTLELASAWSA